VTINDNVPVSPDHDIVPTPTFGTVNVPNVAVSTTCNDVATTLSSMFSFEFLLVVCFSSSTSNNGERFNDVDTLFVTIRLLLILLLLIVVVVNDENANAEEPSQSKQNFVTNTEKKTRRQFDPDLGVGTIVDC
jgi:fucose permease